MTYGIKFELNGHVSLMTGNGWMSHRFVGIGAYQHKEWKTRQGAERAAKRWTTVPAEVFTITNTLNY